MEHGHESCWWLALASTSHCKRGERGSCRVEFCGRRSRWQPVIFTVSRVCPPANIFSSFSLLHLSPNRPRFTLFLHPIKPFAHTSLVHSALKKLWLSRYGSTQHARHHLLASVLLTWVPRLEAGVSRPRTNPRPGGSLSPRSFTG